jgi:hypothetical protein
MALLLRMLLLNALLHALPQRAELRLEHAGSKFLVAFQPNTFTRAANGCSRIPSGRRQGGAAAPAAA